MGIPGESLTHRHIRSPEKVCHGVSQPVDAGERLQTHTEEEPHGWTTRCKSYLFRWKKFKRCRTGYEWSCARKFEEEPSVKGKELNTEEKELGPRKSTKLDIRARFPAPWSTYTEGWVTHLVSLDPGIFDRRFSAIWSWGLPPALGYWDPQTSVQTWAKILPCELLGLLKFTFLCLTW